MSTVSWGAGLGPNNKMGVVSQQLQPNVVYQVGGDPHIFFSGTFIYSGSASGTGILYLQFGGSMASWIAFVLEPGQAITLQEVPLNAVMVSNSYFTVVGALFWVENIDRMKPNIILPSTSTVNAIITSPLTSSGNIKVALSEDDISLISNLQTIESYIGVATTQLNTTNSNLSSIITDLSTVTTQLNTTNSDLSSIISGIGTVTTQLNTTNSDLSTIASDLSTISTQLNTAISYLSTASTQLSNISNYELASLVYSTTNASLTSSTGVSITAPGTGDLILQVALSSSATLEVVIAGVTTSLNSGNALSAGALYEFGFHVASGDSITVLASASVTATLLRAFFRYNT